MTLIEELLEKFGVSELRDGQYGAVDAAINGKDILCFMPTGYGKSLCFQMPAVNMYGITLVVSPLIALMNDQVLSLNEKGIGAVAIHGEADYEHVHKKLASNNTKLIYISPERLAQKAFLDFISGRKIERVVIDEAHCISSWGSGFRPEYQLIGRFIRELSFVAGAKIPVSAFTATANHRVIQDIIQFSGIDKNSSYFFKGDVIRKNIHISMKNVKSKNHELMKILSVHRSEPTVIYCGTIKDVITVSGFLRKEGIFHGTYHSKMKKEQKSLVMSDFMSDSIDVIVATSAFGMGVNKSNIRHVIHYQLPESIEMYYQQVGRAGRDGIGAMATLLFNGKDRSHSRFMTQLSFPKYENVWSVIVALNSINIDGIVDMPLEDLLLICPIKLTSHELTGVIKLLVSKNMVNDFTDIHTNSIRLEIVDLNKKVNKTQLQSSRQNAIDAFDELYFLAQSTMCRSFLIDDYFSSKKLPYKECGYCDNCIEKHENSCDDFIALEDLKIIYSDLKNIELFESDELAMHWLGYGKLVDSDKSCGIFKDFEFKRVRDLIAKLTRIGFFISIAGKFIVCKEAFEKSIKAKSSLRLIDCSDERGVAINQMSDSVYRALKNHRDKLAEDSGLLPDLILNDIQIRRIATSAPLTKEDMAKVVGKEKTEWFYNVHLDG